MSTREEIYQYWLNDWLRPRVMRRESPIDLNVVLPPMAERLGLQDPFQYIADHDGKGTTTCQLLGALALAQAGLAVAYTSRTATLAQAYGQRAVGWADFDKCVNVTRWRIEYKGGGMVVFLHPASTLEGYRFNEIIEDD